VVGAICLLAVSRIPLPRAMTETAAVRSASTATTDELRRTSTSGMITAPETLMFTTGTGASRVPDSRVVRFARGSESVAHWIYNHTSAQTLASVVLSALGTCDTRAVAVLRALDSMDRPDDLVAALRRHAMEPTVVSGNVCLLSAQVQELCEAELFNGFDEVWIFPFAAPSQDLSTTPYLQCHPKFDELPPELIRCLEQTRPLLAAGDGLGLNYVTSSASLSEAIKSDLRASQ
jgi:hypothetical protein